MTEVHITLSSSERDSLVNILSEQLKQKRVEVHRTEFSRDFRREVEAEEDQLSRILQKLSQAASD